MISMAVSECNHNPIATLLLGGRRRVSGLGPQPGLLFRRGGGLLLGTTLELRILFGGQLDVLDLLEELLAAGGRQRLAVVALDDPVLQEAGHVAVTRALRLPQRRVAPPAREVVSYT